MGRNDAYLYAGSTAESPLAYQKELRGKAKEAKERQRQELQPKASEILDVIDNEIRQTELEILQFVSIGTPTDAVKDTLVALNLYESSCKKLKVKMQAILRKAE